MQAAAEGQAQQLDDMLWTFKQNSFVPHARYPCAPDETAPVRIGSGAAPDWEAEVLINLALDVPDFYQRFQRVAELVDQEPTVLQASRRRFKFYREQGLQPQTHKL